MHLIRSSIRKKGEEEFFEHYVWNIEKGKLEVITDQLYAKDFFSDEIRPISLAAISKPFSATEVMKAINWLPKKYPNVSFRIIKKENYHLVAEGQRKHLNELPKLMAITPKHPLFTPTVFLTEIKGILPEIEKNFGKYVIIQPMKMETFANIKEYSFDTEFMNWETRGEVNFQKTRNSKKELIKYLNAEDKNQYSKTEDKNDKNPKKNYQKMRKKELVDLVEESINKRLLPKNQFNKDLYRFSILDFFKEQKVYKKSMEKENLTKLRERVVKLSKKGKLKNTLIPTPITQQISEKKDGQYIVHYYEILAGKSEEKKFTTKNGNFLLKRKVFDSKEGIAKSVENMINEINEDFKKFPIILLVSQNGYTYDLKETRLHGQLFHDHRPNVVSAQGFFEQVIIKPIIHFDSAPFMQNYMPLTIDNKWSTYLNYLGFKVSKEHGYEQLTQFSYERMLGRIKSADDQIGYGSDDTIQLNLAWQKVKKTVKHLMDINSTTLEATLSTSKQTLGLNIYLIKHLKEKLVFPEWICNSNGDVDTSSFEKFKNYKIKHINLVSQQAKYKFKIMNSSGLVKGKLYYLMPFTKMFEKKISRFKEVKNAIESLEKEECIPARLALSIGIEEGYILPYAFEAIEKTKIIDEKIIEKMSIIFEKFTPTNKSKNFYLFNEEITKSEEFINLTKELGGFEVAKGRVANFKKGSFILNDENNWHKQGIDTKGNLGFRTIIQKEFIENYLPLLLSENGQDKAIEYVKKYFSKILNGEVEREKLIYFKKSILEDYENYSSPSQRQERIKAHIQFELKAGEELAYAKINSEKKGRIPLDKFLNMKEEKLWTEEYKQFILDTYIGPRNKKGRTLNGALGIYLRPLANCQTKQDLEFRRLLDRGFADKDNNLTLQTTLF